MLNCGVNPEDFSLFTVKDHLLRIHTCLFSERKSDWGLISLTFNFSVKEFKGIYEYQKDTGR